MAYSSLHQCVEDLSSDQLLRIQDEVDPYLEMAEIHRRVFDAGGPALLFEKVKGSPFRALSNLYGTKERTAFLFRNTLDQVQDLIRLKADPGDLLRHPFTYAGIPLTALKGLPLRAKWNRPILKGMTKLSLLPQVVCWPEDGGAFITLPQVLSLPPGDTTISHSNIGMYRIQISGNEYIRDAEAGMHYQLHRGIGVHHTLYNQSGGEFKISIFIGGPPSHSFAAIMPLPENLSEVTFAGLLGGRRFRYFWKDGYILSADADFCITGTVRINEKKPEGPFGDHLGYYSLKHDFPVLDIKNIYHRKNPIWHFTVVGRPPQEDSNFGWLIHQLVEPLAPTEFPGLKEVHAVDAAGVHPLLLAIGRERYMPFREPVPEELLTIANHLLGKGQTSLAKYLFIACDEDDPHLSTHRIPEFFQHVLSRIDLSRDLHFQTRTTIDTLDYSGDGWNSGSKLVIAARGPVRRKLSNEVPAHILLPSSCKKMELIMPGVLAISFDPFSDYNSAKKEIELLCQSILQLDLEQWPLWILTEESTWMSAQINNFLWATFTRSNPAKDIYGAGAEVIDKHWSCQSPLIIDARIKTHHAPVLESDPRVSQKVDKMFAKGGMLYAKVKGL
ncbi:MAG: UbiD family decarboxylase [Saprospiraceae bacterium]|uniref:UbiD family decarboxylase n=1 Tax=Candidatus Opimibacter skivensis TaxID=2982028 RepID=A0A9D7ST73_9BACT|nr:UbiD family decarboxylase [Candidatus Opimibacter skivensis]